MDFVTGDDRPAPSAYAFNPRAPSPPASLIALLKQASVALVSDCMDGAPLAVGLSAYHRACAPMICGPATTVRTPPGDNLVIHKALYMAEPGDVIVVEAGSDVRCALVGGLMRAVAISRGLEGFVIDGALRDVAEWRDGAIGAFALGHTPHGPRKNGPGEVNKPIVCAGLRVNPGDIVLGDADGVIAIPRAEASALAPKIEAAIARERQAGELSRGGGDPARIDNLLRANGAPL